MQELTADYGFGRAGDCGSIFSVNNDGTVNINVTRRRCMPIRPRPVLSVPREILQECRCETATYNVRSGDELGRIAEFHGVGGDTLLSLNPQIEDAASILPGQTINVPLVDEDGHSIHAQLAQGPGPKWFQIATREMETGVDEIPGADHNPRIVEYHQSTTLRATSDEVPWCSSFVNWCMMKAGIERTHSAAARSWLNWGQALQEPRKGCVVIFTRPPNPASGHVAFFDKDKGERIRVLGGNQGDQVSMTTYPKSRLLGFRWPSEG